MNIKQLFCQHLWKFEKEIPLHVETTNTFIFKELYCSDVTEVYAVQFKCIKCGMKKLEEHKYFKGRKYV